jgi:hypothetical protein
LHSPIAGHCDHRTGWVAEGRGWAAKDTGWSATECNKKHPNWTTPIVNHAVRRFSQTGWGRRDVAGGSVEASALLPGVTECLHFHAKELGAALGHLITHKSVKKLISATALVLELARETGAHAEEGAKFVPPFNLLGGQGFGGRVGRRPRCER